MASIILNQFKAWPSEAYMTLRLWLSSDRLNIVRGYQ